MINDNINVTKKRKCLRVMSFITLLVVCFSLIVPLSFKQNNVSASSISFIQQNDYTFSLGNITGYENRVYNSVDNIYISYSEIVDDDDEEEEFPTMYLNYPIYSSNNIIRYQSFLIDTWSYTNSTTYKYINDSVNITLGGFLSSYEGVELSMVELFVDRIDININRSTFGDGTTLFDNADYIIKTCYNRDGYYVNRFTIRSNGLTTDLMTIYFYCLVNGGTPQFSNTSITQPIVKIDRSEYVNTEFEEVYVDPLLDPIKSLVDGVSSFLSIEIFPNFTLGNIIILLLAIAFFSFLLHLLVK